MTADGSWQSAMGRRKTADGSWQAADGNGQWAIGSGQSATISIANCQFTIEIKHHRNKLYIRAVIGSPKGD